MNTSMLKRVGLLAFAGLLSSSTLMAQAGSLDPTFGNGGIVTTPNTTTSCGSVVSCKLAIQSNGKIVVAGGASQSNGAPELALARYNLNGSLDSTFGNGGLVFFATNNGGPAIGLAIQGDGKIVTAAPTNLGLDVFRYNSNGTLDSTFGNGGIFATRAAGLFIGDTSGGIALLGNGKILVAAGVALLQLLPNGQMDTGFGTGGVAQLLTGAQALALLSIGKSLVISSFTFTTGSPIQYNPNGSLDATFGVRGQASSLGEPLAIVPLSDGKFVVAGTLDSAAASLGNSPPQGFALTRYNNNGTVDTTFGNHGSVVTTFPGNGYSAAMAVAVQLNGDLVAAGVTELKNPVFGAEASDFALARYTSNGQLDATFGNNGLVTTPFGTNGENSASVSALAIQSDGKIVAVGYDNSGFQGPNNGFTLARYLSH